MSRWNIFQGKSMQFPQREDTTTEKQAKQDKHSSATLSEATAVKYEGSAIDFQHHYHHQTCSCCHRSHHTHQNKRKLLQVDKTEVNQQIVGVLEILRALEKLSRENRELQREIDRLRGDVTRFESQTKRRRKRRNFGLAF